MHVFQYMNVKHVMMTNDFSNLSDVSDFSIVGLYGYFLLYIIYIYVLSEVFMYVKGNKIVCLLCLSLTECHKWSR